MLQHRYMEAHHIKTKEPGQRDLLGTPEFYFTLDSLLIPDASIMMGYSPKNARSGKILSYPYPSEYARRAEFLVYKEGKLPNGEKIKGEVVSKIELPDELVENIRRMYKPFREGVHIPYWNGRDVRLGWDYKGTTRELVYILSGGQYINTGRGKRRRRKFSLGDILSRFKPSPIPIPVPAFS